MSGIEVYGSVADGFEEVREEFAAAVAEETAEPGAQLAAYVQGRPVVDLWAGDDIDGSTLLPVYSNSKGAAHLVVALLVQEGVLDLDRQVVSYWPEFVGGGKERLTLRELIAHRSGLIGVDGGFTLEELADDRVVAARLAGQRPFWEPGTAYGYHALTIGALTGEVVRRATGRTLQEVYEERIRAPHGLDLWLGLPEAEEARLQPTRPMAPTPEQQALLDANRPSPEGLLPIAFNRAADPSFAIIDYANSRTVRALGPASGGGVGTARGLARLYAAALSGVDGAPALLKPETIAEFTERRWTGTDAVTGDPDHFTLGFETEGVRYPALGATAFGHAGAAGSEALADPRTGLAYGYTRRRFAFPGCPAPENQRLVAAVARAAEESVR
ncbi:beta-lactamase family protein [Streptomyces sp. NBC_00006]|uniref:serine hydrolase domain-containing protein n=1 Tax=unclassified Streptomyces TaxID=2593676 RepID=UPI002250A631|nr:MULTISPECIES: serine hydrolase domain-containing protein [unclassified Streptomyces]MCX4830137.1 beta-lactamase family protein [Streptomyces sp. NBC_01016]MCX5530534.1 beta-lactamase family protein [Streptomyces sp. NBC_00006]